MMKIKKSRIVSFLIVLFPIINLMKDVPVIAYYDELLGVIAMAYSVYMFVQNKIMLIDRRIFYNLLMITVIGLLSNVTSDVSRNLFSILVDALWLWKPFACYLFFKYVVMSINKKQKIISILAPLAKLIIIFTFVVAVVGQFVDIGVSGGSKVMGIEKFAFFWKNGIQTGWLLFVAIMILSAARIRRKIFYTYLVIAIIPLMLTFSSLVYCWVFVTVFLLFLLREEQQIKKRYILLMAVGVMLFSFADIEVYSNSESVRMVFIKYAIVTANTFLPLGAGFATYGTEMAARYYSPLYVKYGWLTRWGMNPEENQFLNDTFFAGILGQFGWIGFILYLGCIYLLFRNTNSESLSKHERITTGATIITIAVTMIGSATAKSMMGVCAFSVLGIICADNKKEYEGEISDTGKTEVG